MSNKYQELVRNIEKIVLNQEITSIPKTYKKMGFYWIKSFPKKEIKNLFSIPSIRLYPQRDIRAWSIWFYYLTKTFKFNKEQFVYLLGAIPAWSFMTRHQFAIHSNFFYSRGRNITLLYPEKENQFVLKIHISRNGTNKLQNEVACLLQANTIYHPNVETPKLLKKGNIGATYWYTQEMLYAKDVGNISSHKRQKIYNEVFEFMVDFYRKNKIFLKSPLDDNILHQKQIKEFLKFNKYGFKILLLVDSLLIKEKKMIEVHLHNDIYDKNILISKFVNNKKLYIIDWGNSARGYLVHEFRNKIFDKQQVFDKIIRMENISIDSVYNLEEQIFLEEYIDTCIIINKFLNNSSKELNLRINNRLKKLSQFKI